MTDFGSTLWMLLVVASVAFTGAVAAYLLQRREVPGALPLGLGILVISLWSLTYAAEVTTANFETQRLWFAVRNALPLPGATLSLWFALEYAGLGRLLSRPVVATLAAWLLAVSPFYVIDDGRYLWARVWWDGGIRADLTPLGQGFAAYGFGLFVLSTVVFVLLYLRSPAHRVPVALILLAQVAIRVAYALGALNLGQVPGVPGTVLALDFATLVYLIALTRFRLFDLVPLARETIIERMPDAMLVLDAEGRIADLNEAAARLVDAPRPRALGRPASTVLASFPDLVTRIRECATAADDLALATAAGVRWCQVTTSPLADWHGRPIGCLVLLRDVTDLRHAQDRLLEHERALAVAEEREQMARDLHDGVGQVLGYVSMQADATHKLLADERRADAGLQLKRLADVAREAHADMRGYIQELHETPAERRPLSDALRHLLDRFKRNYAIAVAFTADPALEGAVLAHEEERQLLRIVQEALTNARRHGNARHVRVAAEAHDSWVVVAIEDDGRGFDPGKPGADRAHQYGLRFMRDRIEQVDGELEIASSPGHGTHVVVRVPIVPHADAAAAGHPTPVGDGRAGSG